MPARRGIVIICGPMFSQKSADLMLREQKARHAGHAVLIIKPVTDTRDENVRSRTGLQTSCIKLDPQQPEQILELATGKDVVIIDEAQFFSSAIVTVVQRLYEQGKRILVACLDADLFGKPFGPIPLLLAIPEAEIKRKRAVCQKCQSDNATRTDLKDKKLRRALQAGKPVTLIGDTEFYQALCYDCYQEVNRDDIEYE